MQQERDELYRKFTAAIQEVQQKTGFKNLVLERKLQALSAAVEKKEVQFNEVLAASNLDPAALTLVSRKLEVGPRQAPGPSGQPLPCGKGLQFCAVPPRTGTETPRLTTGRGQSWVSCDVRTERGAVGMDASHHLHRQPLLTVLLKSLSDLPLPLCALMVTPNL